MNKENLEADEVLKKLEVDGFVMTIFKSEYGSEDVYSGVLSVVSTEEVLLDSGGFPTEDEVIEYFSTVSTALHSIFG